MSRKFYLSIGGEEENQQMNNNTIRDANNKQSYFPSEIENAMWNRRVVVAVNALVDKCHVTAHWKITALEN